MNKNLAPFKPKDSSNNDRINNNDVNISNRIISEYSEHSKNLDSGHSFVKVGKSDQWCEIFSLLSCHFQHNLPHPTPPDMNISIYLLFTFIGHDLDQFISFGHIPHWESESRSHSETETEIEIEMRFENPSGMNGSVSEDGDQMFLSEHMSNL
jgi:hypothetical protein